MIRDLSVGEAIAIVGLTVAVVTVCGTCLVAWWPDIAAECQSWFAVDTEVTQPPTPHSPPAPFSLPARKGFDRSRAQIVDIEDRRQTLNAAIRIGNPRIH